MHTYTHTHRHRHTHTLTHMHTCDGHTHTLSLTHTRDGHTHTHTHTYSGLFPHAILFLRRLPVIGHVLNLPGIKTVSATHSSYGGSLSSSGVMSGVHTGGEIPGIAIPPPPPQELSQPNYKLLQIIQTLPF